MPPILDQFDRTFQIGFVLYPHYDPIDIAGPYEALSWMANEVNAAPPNGGKKDQPTPQPKVSLHVLASTLDPLPTSTGLKLYATQTFADFEKDSKLDLIFVPGGTPDGFMDAMENPEIMGFIKRQSKFCSLICSVCFGSFLLGKAGLLKGCEATTYWTGVELLHLFRGVKVAPYFPRWIFNNKSGSEKTKIVVTGGGISSGIDQALYLVSLLAGTETAKRVQLGIQYNPMPPMHGGDPTVSDPVLWQGAAAGFAKEFGPRLKKIIGG